MESSTKHGYLKNNNFYIFFERQLTVLISSSEMLKKHSALEYKIKTILSFKKVKMLFFNDKKLCQFFF